MPGMTATLVDLGLMQGTPPPVERLVTPDNWIEGPFNRWGFLHVREVARTARIARGDGPVEPLETDLRDLGSVPVTFGGATVTVADALEHTYTDGLCVIHDGRVVFEHYVDGMRPDDTHLLMSVSKSLTGTLIGVLAGQGVLDPADAVTDRIAALRGTAWEGCTLRHLLDMRAGTRFDESDYENAYSDGVLIEQISGYRPHRRPDLPPNTYAWIAALPNDGVHGGPFRYRSILTDVLAWAAAEATGTRFPELFSELIWSRIGAERDAEVIVDAAGFAAVEGGICTTLRDLARFGLMHLDDGAIGGRRVVAPTTATSSAISRTPSTTISGGSGTATRASTAATGSTASSSSSTARRGRSSPASPRGRRAPTSACSATPTPRTWRSSRPSPDAAA
jgi:CubicO group peptidase (beta-lactamase class C family)